MPYLIVAGLAGVVGLVGGFTASGGVKETNNTIKYVALGVGAFLIAKKMGYIKI
jgi:hypothetical protein